MLPTAEGLPVKTAHLCAGEAAESFGVRGFLKEAIGS
jgi:hypothetical protein